MAISLLTHPEHDFCLLDDTIRAISSESMWNRQASLFFDILFDRDLNPGLLVVATENEVSTPRIVDIHIKLLSLREY